MRGRQRGQETNHEPIETNHELAREGSQTWKNQEKRTNQGIAPDYASRPRDLVICFSNEYYKGTLPHQDDPMVISLIAVDYKIERVLVDQGSSTNVKTPCLLPGRVPRNLIWIHRRASRDKGIRRDLDCVCDRSECRNNPNLLYSCQHLGLLQHDHRVVGSEQIQSGGVHYIST
ncbi:hypothetical protein CR513_33411, partial [Mucuna pruriens]